MLGAHRVIRRLEPDEGPYAGALVTDGRSVAVLVSAETISGWSGWEHAGDDHVAAPLDVVRRVDGHDVLLPWCTEQIPVFLGRRAAAGAALGAGEVTTLVASVLRGLAELSRIERRETGEWWLTDDGRPMFVIGAGAEAAGAAASILDLIGEDSQDRALSRVLTPIAEGLRRSSERPVIPVRQLQRWEGTLLEFAAPRPLQRGTQTPEGHRGADVARRAVDETVDRVSGARREPTRREPTRREPTRRARPRGARSRGARSRGSVSLTGVIGATLGVVSERGRSLRERWRRSAQGWSSQERVPVGVHLHGRAGGDRGRRTGQSEAPRRRRYLIAAAAAVTVLGAGMLWPGGGTDDSAGAKEARTPVTEARDASGDQVGDTATPQPTPSATTVEDAADPIGAARALLREIDDCADAEDLVCADAVAGTTMGIVELLAARNAGEARTLTPVDEYGDVAVIRLSTSAAPTDEAPAERHQMVVLVRMAEKWLIRDAYDVADQPE